MQTYNGKYSNLEICDTEWSVCTDKENSIDSLDFIAEFLDGNKMVKDWNFVHNMDDLNAIIIVES